MDEDEDDNAAANVVIYSAAGHVCWTAPKWMTKRQSERYMVAIKSKYDTAGSESQAWAFAKFIHRVMEMEVEDDTDYDDVIDGVVPLRHKNANEESD